MEKVVSVTSSKDQPFERDGWFSEIDYPKAFFLKKKIYHYRSPTFTIIVARRITHANVQLLHHCVKKKINKL